MYKVGDVLKGNRVTNKERTGSALLLVVKEQVYYGKARKQTVYNLAAIENREDGNFNMYFLYSKHDAPTNLRELNKLIKEKWVVKEVTTFEQYLKENMNV